MQKDSDVKQIFIKIYLEESDIYLLNESKCVIEVKNMDFLFLIKMII
jgi:hypothetical protein